MTSVAAREMIALNLVPGLSPRVIKRLVESVRAPDEIFRMTESEIRKIVLKPADLATKIRRAKAAPEYEEELAYMRENSIEAVCAKDESYPEDLRNIYDPPAVLYSRGALSGSGANAVAMVGARRCSAYGLQMAERIAFDLAKEGITVVSGMARGIDTASHKGVIKAGGKTVAVMGSGFKHIYPPEAKSLIPAIVEKGAVITEYASGTIPFKGNFPRRNRIISGMVRAVIVVEAAVRSGAMITANFALSEGRDVFAVPGRADFYSSKGSNMLIQKGAALVMSADDVLKELNVESDKTENEPFSSVPQEQNTKEEYGGMMKLLRAGPPVHIDRISEETGIELKNLSAVLLSLQIRGTIKELPGKNYVLTK